MFEVFLDALIDSAKMLPLLLLIYIGIELLEYKYGQKMREKISRAGKAGPAAGAFFGLVPECGFSVIATTLYTQKLVTLGTLLAVYFATSDEAIPMILSRPDKAQIILPLIGIKIIIALFFGYFIDFFASRYNKKVLRHIEKHEEKECQNYKEEVAHEDRACCGHNIPAEKFDFKEIFLHPLIHTAKVFLFIFVVSFLIGLLFYQIGEDGISKIFFGKSVFQPVLAGLVGLIPNCAASVAITQFYLDGVISFGSTIAGLSAAGGLGLIVLLKENKNFKDTLKIIGLLLLISVFVGILIQQITAVI